MPDLDVARTSPGAAPSDAEWAPNPARIIAKGLGTEAIWFRVTLTVALTKGFAWGPFDERSYKGIVRPQKVAELDPVAAC